MQYGVIFSRLRGKDEAYSNRIIMIRLEYLNDTKMINISLKIFISQYEFAARNYGVK